MELIIFNYVLYQLYYAIIMLQDIAVLKRSRRNTATSFMSHQSESKIDMNSTNSAQNKKTYQVPIKYVYLISAVAAISGLLNLIGYLSAIFRRDNTATSTLYYFNDFGLRLWRAVFYLIMDISFILHFRLKILAPYRSALMPFLAVAFHYLTIDMDKAWIYFHNKEGPNDAADLVLSGIVLLIPCTIAMIAIISRDSYRG